MRCVLPGIPGDVCWWHAWPCCAGWTQGQDLLLTSSLIPIPPLAEGDACGAWWDNCQVLGEITYAHRSLPQQGRLCSSFLHFSFTNASQWFCHYSSIKLLGFIHAPSRVPSIKL